MAITTLANVKTALGITGTAEDAIINFLIPQIEDDFLRIRNKPFDFGVMLTVTSGATTAGDVEVEVDGGEFLVPVRAGDNPLTVAGKISQYVGRFVDSYQSGTDVIFYGWVDVAFDARGTGAAVTIGDVDTIYPIGSELTAIKMVQWHKDRIKSLGVQSESLGDYSVTFGDIKNDYPKNIIGGIRRFASWA